MSGLHPYFSHLVHADLTVKNPSRSHATSHYSTHAHKQELPVPCIKPAKKTLLLDTVSRIHCGKTEVPSAVVRKIRHVESATCPAVPRCSKCSSYPMIFLTSPAKGLKRFRTMSSPGSADNQSKPPRTQHSIMTSINKCEAAMLQASRDGSERMR